MIFLITAALAGLEGTAWWLLADGQRMPYWLMLVFILAAIAGAGWAEKALDRWQEQRRRIRRTAIVDRWNADGRSRTDRP